jgi:hypothetical protein
MIGASRLPASRTRAGLWGRWPLRKARCCRSRPPSPWTIRHTGRDIEINPPHVLREWLPSTSCVALVRFSKSGAKRGESPRYYPYGLSPWEHGRRCKVTALSTGLPCKRAVLRGYDVCASWGKAGQTSKAIMAAPYDPVAAAARKGKREKHREYSRSEKREV